MNPHSTYETMRQLADSWGLLLLMLAFIVLTAWPFRPGSRDHHRDAANMIFRDENDGE